MANATITTVQLVYKRVIDETIKNSRETFLNEGIEESVLQELRTLWESKVSATRAVEPAMNPPDYIPRGQIYKYNYRNQPPATTQPPATGTTFNAHIPGFLSQVVQQQQEQRQQQQSNVIAARQQLQQQHQQNVAPQLTVTQPHPVAQQHAVITKQPPQQLTAPPQLPRVIPMTTSRPTTSQTPGSLPSSFPPTIPFPSLSGVTTVTKNEFNNASDSIQVDGSCDVIPEVTRDSSSRDFLRDPSRDLSVVCGNVDLGMSASDLQPLDGNPSSSSTGEVDHCCQKTSNKTDLVACQHPDKPSGSQPTTNPSPKNPTFSSKGKHPASRGDNRMSATSEKTSSQKHKVRSLPKGARVVLQLDGAGDSDEDVGEFVDSEDSEDDDNDDTDEEIDVGGDRSGFDDPDKPSSPVEEEDPLNSEDDDSDDGNIEFEATDNVVVCLFDKITRSKNKWKLYLKEGVMNIGGKDHVFHKAIGDGEW